MRCERIPTLLATGGPFGRWRARRHADRCPTCAEESARILGIAQGLATLEPLTPAERALWTTSSVEGLSAASAWTWLRPALGAGLAGASVLVFVLLRWGPEPEPPPVKNVPRPAIAQGSVPRSASPDAIRALDGLKADLLALSRELDGLRRRASLLDERRDAEALEDRYALAGSLNGH